MNSNLIAVTNWNDFQKTSRCILSIIKCVPNNYDILVVDNFSSEQQYSLLLNFIYKIAKKKKIEFFSIRYI